MPLPLTFDERVRETILKLTEEERSISDEVTVLIVLAKIERPDLFKRVLAIVQELS